MHHAGGFYRLIDESVVIGVILVNTLALFMMSSAEPIVDVHRSFWLWIDYACVVYFVFEMALKVWRDGWRGYYASPWNRFDFYVVALSSPILLMPVIDLHQFSVVLLLRLGRLFRVFRLLRFIPDRQRLVAGIYRSLKASVGIFLAVVLFNFILALGASMLFGELAPEYFGNPFIACFSMFQIFTVEGWYEVPAAIANHPEAPEWAASVARLYFVIAVFVGGILGLSLANAVFVDQMVLDNNDDLEFRVERLTEEIRALRAEVQRSRETS